MEEFEEIVAVWNGNINDVRTKMRKFESVFGKKISFPVYFHSKAMFLPGDDEVEYGSEIYMSVEDGKPVMEVAMPSSHRNINVRISIKE